MRGAGYRVLANVALAPGVHRLEVRAPRVAVAARAGQFVIVRLGEGAERIPLTIVEADAGAGSISLVVQAVGRSTRDIVALAPGAAMADVAGPLGRPSELVTHGRVVCVSGGVGAAVSFPSPVFSTTAVPT
jgi:ferredoxin--NADP+ reductase